MILESYKQRRDVLEKEMANCTDVKTAADCLGRTLEWLRLQTRAELDKPALRREMDRLFDAAEQAALLMMTVTEADVHVRRTITPPTPRERVLAALPWASAGVGLVLTAWMMLIGENAAAVISLISAGLGTAQARIKQEQVLPQLETCTRVNVYELMRLTDRLIQAMSDSLERIQLEQVPAIEGDLPRLSSDLLAPVQMLMEAVYTQDGAYALKAMPQLIEALKDEGIELVDYTEEKRDCFDLFPGTEPDLTIRPAVVKDGRVLARGQATEQI